MMAGGDTGDARGQQLFVLSVRHSPAGKQQAATPVQRVFAPLQAAVTLAPGLVSVQ